MLTTRHGGRFAYGLIATISAMASPALAQDSAPAAPGSEEEIKVVGKKVCKMETSIGSMMPRRVCRTKSQSREEERATAAGIARLDELQQIQDVQRNSKCQRNGC